MAVESGIGLVITLDDATPASQTITTSIFSYQMGMPKALADITTLAMSAMARLQLLGDFTATIVGGFDDAGNALHAVVKSLQSSANTRTHTAALSGQTLTAEVWIADYQLNRSQDGNIQATVPLSLATGVAPAWT